MTARTSSAAHPWAWLAYRTVEQAQISNPWIVHTQEVLAVSETVLTTVINAHSAVRRDALSSDARALEPLDRVERTTFADVNRVAALTADNPNHQAHVSALREQTARVLALTANRWSSRARGESRHATTTLDPPVEEAHPSLSNRVADVRRHATEVAHATYRLTDMAADTLENGVRGGKQAMKGVRRRLQDAADLRDGASIT